MAHMTWVKEWDTGIAVIDRQHARIVELINELDRAREHGGTSSGVQAVMRELIDYTQTHFAFEEELQVRADYPFAEAHRYVHTAFTKRVVDYQVRLLAGEDVTREVGAMLEQWLVNHIKEQDADYAPLVRAKLANQKLGNQKLASLKRPSPVRLTGALSRMFKSKRSKGRPG